MLITNKHVRCAGIALLGLLNWMPVAHSEEASLLGKTASEAVEETGPEHCKINTPDASPVDPGHFEIESSYTYLHSKRFWDNGGDTHGRGLAREQSVGLTVTVGVVENFDVAVGGSYAWLKDQDNDFDSDDVEIGPKGGHGFSDLELSAKYRFWESKEHRLALAYIGGLTLATGSDSSREEVGTSQEFSSFNQALVASKDWGKWTANADVGYALPLGDKRENARGTFNADVAVGYQALPWLQPELELNYGHGILSDKENSEVLAVTAGLVMPINDRFRVNLGLQQGVWGRNNDKETTLSVAAKMAF